MTTVGFRREADPAGLRIVDRVSGEQCRLGSPGPVDPEPATTDAFPFPVSRAVRLRARSLTLPTIVSVFVHDDDGRMLATVENDHYESFPRGCYYLELCTPVKTYLRVESPVVVSADDERMRFEFGGETTITAGARSLRRQPAATITTSPDPHDVMAAVGLFGSALHTTTPERAFPTLRGHPPAVELGDELAVPDGVDRPETGIRLELPPTLEAVYAAAPLAYYLGADLVPGGEPLLATDEGFEQPLSGDDLAGDVERLLKRTFLLDSVTRTEGHYKIDLAEADAVRDRIDLDLGAVYAASPAERLAAYCSVPYDAVRPLVPAWPRTAHVEPAPESAECLPHLVDGLALVRPCDPPRYTGDEARSRALDAFVAGGRTRSAGEVFGGERSFVDLPATDEGRAVWVGDDVPLGADEAVAAGYRNRHAREPRDREHLQVTVVCNDPGMDDELSVAERIYGSREELPFELTTYDGLDRAALAAAVRADADVLHYVGHATADGLRCPDGALDLAAVDGVGADVFLLNACQSYSQGRALVEGGAVGGVVTLSDVADAEATDVGVMVARLLNAGFPLGAALDVARAESFVGGQYLVVGDGEATVTQSEGGVRYLPRVAPADGGYEVTLGTFPTRSWGLGTVLAFQLGPGGRRYLHGRDVGPFSVSREELREFLDLEPVPVEFDGELRWSTDLEL